MSRRRFNFPLDLPDNWQDIQYLSASGDAFDPPDEKRGYNYLSKRINDLAEAINSLSSPEEDCVYRDQGSENPHKVIATTEEGICLAHNVGRSLEIDEETHTLQCKRLVENAEAVSGGIRFTFNTGEQLGVTTVLSSWQPKTAYIEGDIARSPLLKSYEYLQCTKSGTSGTSFTSEMIRQKVGGERVTDGTCQWRKKDWRCKHNTGDIIEKIGDEPPRPYEYLIELDGRSLNVLQYAELYRLFPSSGSLTFNLPDTRDKFTEHTSGRNGQIIEAGLPNITGWVGTEPRGSSGGAANSALCWGSYLGDAAGHSSGQAYQLKIDASRSNPIYGRSNTVQPPAIIVKKYICYA